MDSGRANGAMPDREGLGLHDKAEGRSNPAPVAAPASNSRLHRRADKAFDKEQRENSLDENNEMSEIESGALSVNKSKQVSNNRRK